MTSKTEIGEWDTVGTRRNSFEDHWLGRKIYQAQMLAGILPIPVWEKCLWFSMYFFVFGLITHGSIHYLREYFYD